MANKKISELPVLSSITDDTYVPVAKGSQNYKVTIPEWDEDFKEKKKEIDEELEKLNNEAIVTIRNLSQIIDGTLLQTNEVEKKITEKGESISSTAGEYIRINKVGGFSRDKTTTEYGPGLTYLYNTIKGLSGTYQGYEGSKYEITVNDNGKTYSGTGMYVQVNTPGQDFELGDYNDLNGYCLIDVPALSSNFILKKDDVVYSYNSALLDASQNLVVPANTFTEISQDTPIGYIGLWIGTAPEEAQPAALEIKDIPFEIYTEEYIVRHEEMTDLSYIVAYDQNDGNPIEYVLPKTDYRGTNSLNLTDWVIMGDDLSCSQKKNTYKFIFNESTTWENPQDSNYPPYASNSIQGKGEFSSYPGYPTDNQGCFIKNISSSEIVSGAGGPHQYFIAAVISYSNYESSFPFIIDEIKPSTIIKRNPGLWSVYYKTLSERTTIALDDKFSPYLKVYPGGKIYFLDSCKNKIEGYINYSYQEGGVV